MAMTLKKFLYLRGYPEALTVTDEEAEVMARELPDEETGYDDLELAYAAYLYEHNDENEDYEE